MPTLRYLPAERGYARLSTQSAREDDDRGRHTTTARCMVQLPGGALMIDTPGMREFGMLAASAGVDDAFEDIAELANACRFRDCRHDREPDCAVRAAIGKDLDAERLANYRKLLRESAYEERKSDPAARAAYVRRFRQLTAGADVEKRLKRGR